MNMKYSVLLLCFFMLACTSKEDVLLPKSDHTVVGDVTDHSPIYMFFKTKDKDTLVDVNRKNSIISTNWILNIDKRLPLKLVIPEVIKLQMKKREEKAHKNALAENYYSYADSVGKNMAFLPFTHVYYEIGTPMKADLILYFKKGSKLVLCNNTTFDRAKILTYLSGLNLEVTPRIILAFDKNMTFDQYIQTKVVIREVDSFTNETPREFLF